MKVYAVTVHGIAAAGDCYTECVAAFFRRIDAERRRDELEEADKPCAAFLSVSVDEVDLT